MADRLNPDLDLAVPTQLIKILGRGDLAEACNFVSEHALLTLQQPNAQPDFVQRLREIEKPVLNLSTNPIDVTTMRDFANEIWGPGGFLILGWAAGQSDHDLVYWPYFLLEQRQEPRRSWLRRQYRISMLSGIPRPHRLEIWQQAKQHIRHDDIVVINRFGNGYRDLDLVQHLPWSNHPDWIPQDQQCSAVENTASIDHPAYLACVNITAETLPDTHTLFITEKTWKAIAAGCIPWHGHQGRAAYLGDLGFSDHFDQRQTSPDVASLFCRPDIMEVYHARRQEIAQDIDRFWSDHLVNTVTEQAIAGLENWIHS